MKQRDRKRLVMCVSLIFDLGVMFRLPVQQEEVEVSQRDVILFLLSVCSHVCCMILLGQNNKGKTWFGVTVLT